MQFQNIFKCKVLKIESVGSLQQEIKLEWPNNAEPLHCRQQLDIGVS